MRSLARALPLALALALALVPVGAARADERFDHRGAVGLLVGPGVAFKDEVVHGVVENGGRLVGELGGTLAVGSSGNEVVLETLTTLGGPSHVDWGVAGGYRGYFGEEQVKTFLMLELAAHVTPAFTLGPRVTFGVQYELLPTLGAWAGLAADLSYGAGLRFSAEALAGLQLRSYLLE